MMMQDLETGREVGDAVATALVDRGLIIASTDLTHYEPQKSAEKKDLMVLDAITDLDEVRLQTVVEAHAVSMCGYGPVTAALVAAKKLGAKRAELLKYATSGDVSGDTSQVVGYASVVLTR
jgi:AmmeMemoRadiSam system protein B